MQSSVLTRDWDLNISQAWSHQEHKTVSTAEWGYLFLESFRVPCQCRKSKLICRFLTVAGCYPFHRRCRTTFASFLTESISSDLVLHVEECDSPTRSKTMVYVNSLGPWAGNRLITLGDRAKHPPQAFRIRVWTSTMRWDGRYITLCMMTGVSFFRESDQLAISRVSMIWRALTTLIWRAWTTGVLKITWQ